MNFRPPLLLDSQDVAHLLDYPSCIDAVEEAFRRYGRRETEPPTVCGVHLEEGGFHVKAAVLHTSRRYFAAKTNANFPGNPERHGLPTIQGIVLLFDAACGAPLAVMDSGEITVRRTAAATAVAARHLARPDASRLTLCGCGVQGRAQLEALCQVLPIKQIFAYDADPAAAERLVEEMAGFLQVNIVVVRELRASARGSDVCVTCTPSSQYLLGPNDVQPGSFVAGVGADSPEKRELAPELLAGSRLVVDILEQCAAMGDLHHALAAGALTRESVHAELGEVVAGRKPGRTADEQVFVFDSTGTALQDVAAAALVYERARQAGRGLEFAVDRRARREPPRSGPPAQHP